MSNASVSVTTSVSTITSTLPSSTVTSESTITSSSIITTSIPPSTTTEIPTSSSIPTTSSSSIVVASTSLSTNAGTTSLIIVTSTLPAPTTQAPSTTSSSQTSTSTSSSPSALSASDSGSSSKGGLGTGGKIAIAVVIPVVVVAALIIFGLWFWRKRKARKNAEEQRKNEMAEYGFNPNSDPTLAPAAAAAYAEDASDAPEDNSGYRGWGATSSNRKASTTLGSNGRPVGLAVSDTGSQPGGYQYQGSSPATNPSDHYSADPLMHSHPEHGDGVGAFGSGAAAGAAAGGLARHRSGNNGDIRRGPSNASSAYSNAAAQSEASDDVPGVPGHYYEQEVPYNVYNDVQPQHGPYGDGSYSGADQPVIRDVQARRNTRIERAPTFPQTQGGIAQNF